MTTSHPWAQRLRFVWILEPRKDLVFYLGSALAGWLYAGLIWYAIQTLANPLEEPLGILRLGGIHIPLSLELLVVASWALLLDAPHVWATLARTLCDPDEWKNRGRQLLLSFVWFGFGPLIILTPYAIGLGTAQFGHYLSERELALGATAFFVAFRLWAYYHVVRQHWGFFSLYKRKAGDYQQHRLDSWFFNLTMYLPVVLFLTSPFYHQAPGFPPLGLHQPFFGPWSPAALLYPLAWGGYLGIVLLYLTRQLHLWRRGHALNASKLLYMALIIPLHLAAFSHPLMAAFVVPLVTVGHNIQYHCIVYSYAQNKYKSNADPQYRWVRMLFGNVAVYALVGLVFTFALYRGPWIEWLKAATGLRLDQVGV